MTGALLAGAMTGLGIFLFCVALIPRRVSLVRRVAAFDVARRAGPWAAPRDTSRGRDSSEGEITRRLGTVLAKFCAEQGWELPSLRASLALVGKSFENYLATKLLLALLFFFLPDLELKRKVDKRRRDFRHAIGAFLDLVSMNLAGGRGVPEALMSASEIGTGWAMWRIRDALVNARITGQTPWQALGVLGDEVRIDELRDLSAALSLVAEDGAKVRESLVARAESLRRRELTDLEGQAGERSQ